MRPASAIRIGILIWIGASLGSLAAATAPVKLNGAFTAGGDVDPSFRISADSSRVLYVADQNVNEVDELFSVAATGGTPVRINGPLVTGGDVSPTTSRFSPDGNRAVYRADQETDNVYELYSVASTGGTPVKLNGPLVSWIALSRFSIARALSTS